MQMLKDEIRTQILEVAEQFFFENGYQDTKMRDIAAKVGISVSNLYLYYKNKEAIFAAVIGPFSEVFTNGFDRFVDHEDETDLSLEIDHIFKKIILQKRKKFVILMDKSSGTIYQSIKDMTIRSLSGHISNQFEKSKQIYDTNQFIIEIISRNFVQGFVEIAKAYRDEIWLENQIEIFVTYHMEGIKHLL